MLSWFSNKQQEPKQSLSSDVTEEVYLPDTGFSDSLTDKQSKILTELKQCLIKNKWARSEFDDWYLLRFLRARNFNLKKTLKMFENWLDLRRKYDVDAILEHNLVPKLLPKVEKVFKEHYTGVDKVGRPIKVQQYFSVSKDTILDFPIDKWWQWNFLASEELIHVIFPYCSQMAGKRIDQTVIILDLEKVDMSPILWSSEVRKYFNVTGELGQDCYPEILGQMWIINAPKIFSACWKFIKYFLSAKTLEKIKIYGTDYQQEMHATLGKQNLPTFLGGEIENWENYDMPWKEYQNYCYEQKTWFHCEEMKVSDPMVKVEKYPLDTPVSKGSKPPKGE